MRAKIIPSAPFKNYQELEDLAMKVKGELKRIQIDVCDGKFVPSVSWPFTEYSLGDFEKLGKKNDFDVYLPFWENINYSVDLMCENPQKYIETFVLYGIDEVVIHFRSIHTPGGVHTQETFEKIEDICIKYQLDLILAVDEKTNLQEFIKFVDFNKNSIIFSGFQVMGIEKIGFQNQEFDERSLEIVKTLKENFPTKEIYFDGGIDEDTIGEIHEAGVDAFCVGHFLTEADNFDENLQILKNLVR